MANQTPAQATVAYLDSIPHYLRPRRAIYQRVVEAAGKLQSTTAALVIHSLLGAGGSYGANTPKGPLRFPDDHRLHLDMGTEWYWLACNLEVVGSGGQDRIGVLVSMKRTRSVSLEVQQQAGWSDTEAQLVSTVSTIHLATREKRAIVRRSLNNNWTALGGVVEFGPDTFLYRNGPDVMVGSANILPLSVQIDDGENLGTDLVLSSSLPATQAFFLQGIEGLTPEPTPGLYYSWPQLHVEGSVVAMGERYKVKGIGWIDHQLMMADTRPHVPVRTPEQYFDGWSWCEFNLSNGDALTVAAFQQGVLRSNPIVTYGKYARRLLDGWEPIEVAGILNLDRFIAGLGGVALPSAWNYELADLSGKQVSVQAAATPWYPDGSFQGGDLAVLSETPVNVAVVDNSASNAGLGPGLALSALGYCESIGYEPIRTYQQRGINYLRSQTAPGKSGDPVI
jgi:predicted secreted hydrolase